MQDCEEIESNRLIVREEKGKKITLLNQQKDDVKVVEVDGCEIVEGNRCDWLFVKIADENDNDEIFVELKGSDIKHACLQIEKSIPQLTKNANKLKHAIVVCSKVSPSINTTIQILKAKFKKHLKATLIIRQTQCCFDLSKLKEIDCSRI
jgi:hypothetical protein